MVADKGLGHAEFVHEVTDAELLGGEQAKDRPSQRVANRLPCRDPRCGIQINMH